MPTKIVTFSNPVLISIQMKKKEEFLYSEIETALRNNLWKKNHWNLLSLIREFRYLPRKCEIHENLSL